jgi:hypothetical protein
MQIVLNLYFKFIGHNIVTYILSNFILLTIIYKITYKIKNISIIRQKKKEIYLLNLVIKSKMIFF